MPILQGDIQLRASRVMDDVPEGGGGPSAIVIESGQENAIVPDISEMDRATGRANMRQLHVSVRTDDRDTYQGSNVIVAKPPEDPNVSIALFSTGGVYDTRAQAQARLEAYLNKGAEWPGYLYENHIKGQRVIQIFQRPGTEMPAAGKTLVLVGNEGLSNEYEQYVRVIRPTSIERYFTYDIDKDYKAMIVTLEISDALRYDFVGSSAGRTFTRMSNAARVRDTLVADAGSYVGVSALQKAAALGDFTVIAKTIMTQIVPSAQSETPIPAAIPYAAAGLPVAGAQEVTFTTEQAWSTATSMALPGGCLPGSLKIAVAGATFTDAGGILMSGTQQAGLVDYANGVVTLSAGSYAGAKTVTYRPAAYMQRMPQSDEIRITAENRSQSYTGFITPSPARGTLSASYRAQGRWYVLSDAGDGALRGTDSSYGAGTYSSDTGGYVLTLGALPDVGSSIIWQWGVPTQETVQPAVDIKIAQVIPIDVPDDRNVSASYFQLSWQVAEKTFRAVADSRGELSGDATGSINLTKKELTLVPNTLPPPGTLLNIEYDYGSWLTQSFDGLTRNADGKVQLQLDVPIARGMVEITWGTKTDSNVLGAYSLEQLITMGVDVTTNPSHNASTRNYDSGDDKLYLARQVQTTVNGQTHNTWVYDPIGQVEFGTGTITFNADVFVEIPRLNYTPFSGGGWRFNYGGIVYRSGVSYFPNDGTGWVKVRYLGSEGPNRKSQTVEFKPSFPLIPGQQSPMVPGSIVLQPATGGIISDSGNGALRELGPQGWIPRGSIDYATGFATLTSWTSGVSGQMRRASAVTTLGEAISSAYIFRAAAAPLRPGSLTVQVPDASGPKNVTVGVDGIIVAPGVVGTVDFETGLVRLGFGSFVTAAGNESEPWFNPGAVQSDGTIFKPKPIVASALRYSAVAYAYLPMDPSIIGIDPVRLPSDGRVPIFRPGSLCVVGHTKTSAQLNVSNNQTINLARTRLSRVAVRDANGINHLTGYAQDLEAGIVTFTDVSAMTMPIVIEDRIEDMAVATDVQISGEITFNRALTHEYPKDGTYVSSALQASDRRARVSLDFAQQTWIDNVWVDAATGPAIAAKYDQSVSPIEITNAGGSTERWVLQFTSATQFRVIGEHVGVIATGDINTVCAPLNPATGKPYFTIMPLGWGQGWAVGNILRINTVGALYPFWVVRTIQPGPETGIEHNFSILARGDVNRPQTN